MSATPAPIRPVTTRITNPKVINYARTCCAALFYYCTSIVRAVVLSGQYSTPYRSVFRLSLINLSINQSRVTHVDSLVLFSLCCVGFPFHSFAFRRIAESIAFSCSLISSLSQFSSVRYDEHFQSPKHTQHTNQITDIVTVLLAVVLSTVQSDTAAYFSCRSVPRVASRRVFSVGLE